MVATVVGGVHPVLGQSEHNGVLLFEVRQKLGPVAEHRLHRVEDKQGGEEIGRDPDACVLVSVCGLLDVETYRSGVTEVAPDRRTRTRNLSGNPFGPDPESLHVAEYVWHRPAGRIETVVSLNQTCADEPVSKDLLPYAGRADYQDRRSVGVAVVAEDMVQRWDSGGDQFVCMSSLVLVYSAFPLAGFITSRDLLGS